MELHEIKHLLRLLGELNDVEILILRDHLDVCFYGDKPVMMDGGDIEFRKKHKDALFRERYTHFPADQSFRDKKTVYDSYDAHLARLHLLEPEYEVHAKTGRPAYDFGKEPLRVVGYKIGDLGRLLLKRIGLVPVYETQ